MSAYVEVEPVIAKELKPGDLFSTADANYWDGALDFGSIGEKVYIRTNTPPEEASDAEELVYKITVKQR
jgi:hypothetical protein